MKIDTKLKESPWILATGGILLSLFLAWIATASSSPANHQDPMQIDTYIPRGHVLVPIEVQNFESVDSILGPFGVVDLYPIDSPKTTAQRPAARAVKLLRAPKNPSQFGVLVPEDVAPSLVRHGGPFYVVVQRPDRTGTDFERQPSIKKKGVVYDED